MLAAHQVWFATPSAGQSLFDIILCYGLTIRDVSKHISILGFTEQQTTWTDTPVPWFWLPAGEG